MKALKKAIKHIIFNLPLVRHIFRTRGTAAPITISNFFYQKILMINYKAYWPVHYTSKVTGVKNINIGIGTAPGLSIGCYIQGGGKIIIGDYTIIGPNVGIISANHDIYNYKKNKRGHIEIGNYCWLGMGAIILPDVVLGPHTIVAANSVVNTSFENGYCVIGGVPAKIIKRLDKNKVNEHKNKYEYRGFRPAK